MRFGRKTSFAAGAIVALVIGSGSAYAATGGKLILGYGNSAGKTTTLTNGNGTAMTFNSKAGTPSIRVNRNTKVPNLNADLLDGLDQTRFALATANTGTVEGFGEWVSWQGRTLIMAVAVCPPGTRMTGGGGEDYTADGRMIFNAPLDRGGWWVAVEADIATTEPDVVAYAQCFNPRGNIAGSIYRTKVTTQQSTEINQRLERKYN